MINKNIYDDILFDDFFDENKYNKLNKETKNMLNHDLWLVFSSIKEVLNSLRQYENEITLKAIAKL